MAGLALSAPAMAAPGFKVNQGASFSQVGSPSARAQSGLPAAPETRPLPATDRGGHQRLFGPRVGGGEAALPTMGVPVTVFADGFESGSTCAWGPGTPTCWSVETPEVVIAAGQVESWCYYFRTPNTDTLAVRRWASTLGPAGVLAILYTTYDSGGNPADREPPGTLSTNCGFDDNTAGPSTRANRVYSTHHATEELVLPSDDGSGTPLGMEILANQPVFLQMVFANPGGSAVASSVRLEAEAHPLGTTYTKTATYLTYNSQISIPPGAVGAVASKTCPVPAGAKFWWFSTFTHARAVDARLQNGGDDIVVTSDWQNPSITSFSGPPYYTFAAGRQLTYTCTYDNPSGATINSGNDFLSDESCVGIAYFFPATNPLLCLNDFGPL